VVYSETHEDTDKIIDRDSGEVIEILYAQPFEDPKDGRIEKYGEKQVVQWR
jgi:hypothetical protein